MKHYEIITAAALKEGDLATEANDTDLIQQLKRNESGDVTILWHAVNQNHPGYFIGPYRADTVFLREIPGRLVAFTLSEVLHLISAFGDGNPRRLIEQAFAEKIEVLTDVEISDHANAYLTEDARVEGYTHEDRDEVIRDLAQWRAENGVRQ